MAEFARHVVVAAGEFAIHINANANTLGHRHDDEVFALFQMIEPSGGEDAGVGCIFELDVNACRFLDQLAEIDVPPFQVGREDQPILNGD